MNDVQVFGLISYVLFIAASIVALRALRRLSLTLGRPVTWRDLF